MSRAKIEGSGLGSGDRSNIRSGVPLLTAQSQWQSEQER